MRLPITKLSRVAFAVALYGLPGCASSPSTEPTPINSFNVDTSYGTLSFRGSVDRVDRGREYEYLTHIDVTFHPDRTVNRTPVVNLIACRFVASVPGDDKGPWQMLHEETRPISVYLSRDGQTAHLPELRFRLSKAIAAQARAVGLGLLDGRLMWPIPVRFQ